MATEELCYSERKRKSKRFGRRPKLLVNEKVEVRSVEEGFRGSWHSATVLSMENQARRVQYDSILSDDGSQCLVESIPTSPAVDGVTSACRVPFSYRGLIRPLPPPYGEGKCSLHYGLCVDVYYLEAWWEGVIFDHEERAEVREIFFPDMGDVMQCRSDTLRITFDWDELTEDWSPRGKWMFLDLINEFEKDYPLLVSVRQIWYEVRAEKGFQKLKEWTSSFRKMWKKLVQKVIYDNYMLASTHIIQTLDSAGIVQEPSKSLSETLFDVKLGSETVPDNFGCVVEVENCGSETVSPTDRADVTLFPIAAIESEHILNCGGELDKNLLTSSKPLCNMKISPSFSVVHSDTECPGLISDFKSNEMSTSHSKTEAPRCKGRKETQSNLSLPSGSGIASKPEFSPQSLSEYVRVRNSKLRLPGHVKLKVMKHLAFLGWKVELPREKGSNSMLYTSPDGTRFRSLLKVCVSLIEPQSKKTPPHVIVEPEFCPQAIEEYYSIGSLEENVNRKWYNDSKAKDMQFKARKHLASVGWSFSFYSKGGKHEWRYSSPSGSIYNSLRTACKKCIDEDGLRPINALRIEPGHILEEDCGSEISRDRLKAPFTDMDLGRCLTSTYTVSDKLRTEPAALSLSRQDGKVKRKVGTRYRKERKATLPLALDLCRGKDLNGCCRLLKKRKVSQSVNEQKDKSNGDSPSHLVSYSKRARQVVASSSYQNPRTILSWLIENNMVLPRANIHYISRMENMILGEGRITRDGIKCSCCHGVYSLTKFGAHIGATHPRPAANIFLEDGRSLLDCQSQLQCRNNTRKLIRESHEKKGKRKNHSKNDHICSVCHIGGVLILCDQCPSSFHISCLGLKDVPDGVWFCPSCHCRICGNRISTDKNLHTDESVLNCDQCEHQYHVGCLRRRNAINVDNYPKGNWFCKKRCEQIYVGLHKLVGKSVAVNKDDLTWTLLKYAADNDFQYHGSPERELLTENYSKLNVGLSVMHECFKPVKEPRTHRDLVEDVIFSRRSELRRLNFQGFYTVLLERNEELITVATIRVHGDKVAEMPLVGTRFQYRRLGMCRILMNELEKKLVELGVERLVLPAVPSVLKTWTSSFGFSKMSESDRLSFLDYSFLSFPGTTTCQKLLKKTPSTGLRLLIRLPRNNNSRTSSVGWDGISGISEVLQGDHVGECEVVDQGSAHGVSRSIGSRLQASSRSMGDSPSESSISADSAAQVADHKRLETNDNHILKVYKRRKVSQQVQVQAIVPFVSRL